MSHIPVNHPLRPLYRVLAALAGVYVLLFGVIGFVSTSGDGMFHRGDSSVLGLQTNLAFSIMSIVAGLVIILAIFVGRNVDYVVNLWGGVAFLAVGLAMLTLLQTDLNVLNFSIATCIVSFVIGLVLFSAGLYGRSGSASVAAAEEALRHGGH
jgi:hypothetical protein